MGTARLTILLLLTGFAAGAQADGGAWVELFNGKDLDDWIVKVRGYPTGENFANTFRVEDGLLTVAYDGYGEFGDRFGHLFYKTPFSRYRLLVEYRFTGEQATNAPAWARRNSGVMVHAQDPWTMPDDQDFPISLEVQFLGGLGDGKPRPTANMCSPGTDVKISGRMAETHCVDSASPTFDGDQWVTVEVQVEGSERIVHHVNGQVVMEYGHFTYGGDVVSGHRPDMKPDGEALGSGYIALQSEGQPIQFRRIAIAVSPTGE